MPQVRSALERSTQSTGVLVGGSPKWIVLSDDEAASYDITPQKVRVEREGWSTTLRFQVDAKAIAGKEHFLFAAWPATSLTACDKKSGYARSGCRRTDRSSIPAIPCGRSPPTPASRSNHFQHPTGDQWTSERWIVERFR
jgi:hypothetical protein